MSELKDINETLKKIESKIEDKSHSRSYFTNFMDFGKAQEESRKKREEERNEEILKIQKIQTESIKTQEGFTKIIALTACILALVALHGFLENLIINKFILRIISLIFLAVITGASIPLIKFVYVHASRK